MLKLRVLSEAQPRSKNGQPAHSTTGVASTNWIHTEIDIGTRRWIAGKTCAPISRISTGRASTRPTQKRRVKSTSSWLGPLSAVTVAGSSAMPQIGQDPGWSWRISGCIGQVQIVPSGAATGGVGGPR